MAWRRSAFAAFVSLLACFSKAHACSCVGPQPICSVYFGTPGIFRGTVLERTLEHPPIQTIKNLDGTESHIYTPGNYKVRLSVNETFRGDPTARELTVYTAEQSSACGFPFKVGAEYLVFTHKSQAGDELWTSKCSKTHELNASERDADLDWMRGLTSAPPGSRLFGGVMLARAGPVAGAKVSVRGAVERDVPLNDKGGYELNGLPPGEYRVSATLPAGFSTSPERTVTLPEKGCAEVDWYVSYEGHIKGRVIDVDGVPVAHMMMELTWSNAGMHRGESMMNIKETDEHGVYDFDKVPPGEYFVVANNFGASPSRPYPRVYYPAAKTMSGAAAVTLGASAIVDGLNVVMPRAWTKVTVHARVVHQDGTAAAGVDVYAHEMKNQGSGEPMRAVTGTDGQVDVAVYKGQAYYLTATEQGGTQQRCGGPLRFMAGAKPDVGTIRIEHPWGNCLAQLNPNFRPSR